MTDTKPTNVADALCAEITRVRDEVMPAYLAIGNAGRLALFMMRRDMDAATKALAESDAIAAIRLLASLREYRT